MNKFLYEYSDNIFSQNGEDGINKKIFESIGVTSGILLEIGACDGFRYSNTANLWSKDENYKSILIESNRSFDLLSLESKYENVCCFYEKVDRENSLEKIIDRCKFDVDNDNFVLASIDVDGPDLEVTESLGKYKPKILILESNGCYIEKTNPNGLTISEWISWSEKNSYEFLGMSGFLGKHPGNMYFVRSDLKNNFKITKKNWKDRGILLPGGLAVE